MSALLYFYFISTVALITYVTSHFIKSLRLTLRVFRASRGYDPGLGGFAHLAGTILLGSGMLTLFAIAYLLLKAAVS